VIGKKMLWDLKARVMKKKNGKMDYMRPAT